MRKGWGILAAVLAALGALFAFGYTAMRFSGYLLLCAGVFFLLWGVLERRQNRVIRYLRRGLAALVCTGLLFFTVLESSVVSYGKTDTETPVEAVVILGAGVNGTEPSLSLRMRLLAAMDYLADQPNVPILVTGSRGEGEEISEARCMADWLTEYGIAPERIILEEQADDTEENIRYARALLKKHGIDENANVAVVTSDYHLFRASLYWSSGHMVPVAAKMPVSFWPLTVNYYIREAFAVAELLVFG